MGITERHWFEDEEPELTDRQLEDIVYENKKAYDNGYVKGFHDALKEHPQIVRCKDCKYGYCINPSCDEKEKIYECMKYPIANLRITHKPDWFCADGKQ